MKNAINEMADGVCEFFTGQERPQPRKRGQGEPARKSKSTKTQHGEAEIGLVMEIKHVTRAMAIKILDARAIRLEAERARTAGKSKHRRDIAYIDF